MDAPKRAKLTALFEREYHTLAHLTHPSVIEVYDYGVYENRPYYTMERLEGSDLWDTVRPYQALAKRLMIKSEKVHGTAVVV